MVGKDIASFTPHGPHINIVILLSFNKVVLVFDQNILVFTSLRPCKYFLLLYKIMYYNQIPFPREGIFLVLIIASFFLANISVSFMHSSNRTNTLSISFLSHVCDHLDRSPICKNLFLLSCYPSP